MQHGHGEPSLADESRHTQERLHIYSALAEALSDPHEVLRILMDSDDPDAAQAALREKHGLDIAQARAVLDLQFRRTTKRDLARIAHDREESAKHLQNLRTSAFGAED